MGLDPPPFPPLGKVEPNSTFGKGGAKFNLWERWSQIQPLRKVEPNFTFGKKYRLMV